MIPVADGLAVIPSRPAYSFNSYLLGTVLLDAGTRGSRKRLLRAVQGRPVTAHAVTHAHADHQGASAALVQALGVEMWGPAHPREREALETGDLTLTSTDNVVTRWQRRHWAGPAVHVDRGLVEGDVVGGFTVLETPGHSPGLLSFWREADRVLIAADTMFGRHPITGRPGLHEPPALFTSDVTANRAAIRRLAKLEPAIVCFGHGPPLREGAAEKVATLAASIP